MTQSCQGMEYEGENGYAVIIVVKTSHVKTELYYDCLVLTSQLRTIQVVKSGCDNSLHLRLIFVIHAVAEECGPLPKWRYNPEYKD